MIVGSGLVANSLSKYKEIDDVIVFASGVSNSSEKNEQAFKRELELLISYKSLNKKLVYFSTCSVLDSSISSSKYVIHKLNIESIIKNNFNNYCVLRLPTLVGKTYNPFTFFNYFKNNLLNNKAVNVYSNATRYLLDADDLSLILDLILEKNKNQQLLLNIAFHNKESVLNIVNKMKHYIKSNSPINIIEGGEDLIIDNNRFLSYINNIEYKFNTSVDHIIKKYI